MLNADHEICFVAELEGKSVGIEALILDGSELRAVNVSPAPVNVARRTLQDDAGQDEP